MLDQNQFGFGGLGLLFPPVLFGVRHHAHAIPGMTKVNKGAALVKHVSIFSNLRDLVSNERIGWIVIGMALTAFIVGMVLAIYTGNYVWFLLSLGAFMFMYAVR
jgi:hypothetical protein